MEKTGGKPSRKGQNRLILNMNRRGMAFKTNKAKLPAGLQFKMEQTKAPEKQQEARQKPQPPTARAGESAQPEKEVKRMPQPVNPWLKPAVSNPQESSGTTYCPELDEVEFPKLMREKTILTKWKEKYGVKAPVVTESPKEPQPPTAKPLVSVRPVTEARKKPQPQTEKPVASKEPAVKVRKIPEPVKPCLKSAGSNLQNSSETTDWRALNLLPRPVLLKELEKKREKCLEKERH